MSPTVDVTHCLAADHLSAIGELKEQGFEMCVDLCAVDYGAHFVRPLPDGLTAERFEVVVNLLSLSQRRRARVRTQVGAEDPVIDSITGLYPSADAMEREAFDLFGIRFTGHPDLSRILLPDEWEGHPLRKDFPVANVPIQFKAPARARGAGGR